MKEPKFMKRSRAQMITDLANASGDEELTKVMWKHRLDDLQDRVRKIAARSEKKPNEMERGEVKKQGTS